MRDKTIGGASDANERVRPEAVVFRPSLRPRASAMTDTVSQLVSSILSGDVPPGGKLPPERRLAEMMGVGRSAVREALKALDLLGLIEIRQGDGTYLSRGASDLLPQVVEWGMLLGVPQTRDLIEARSHLEVILAQLAAERTDDAGAASLGERLLSMELAESASDFAQADADFHLTVADLAGNKVLADILVNIKSLLQVWVLRAIRQTGERASTIEQHRAVYEAIRSRDAAAAGAAMERHIAAATHSLHASLDEEQDESEK